MEAARDGDEDDVLYLPHRRVILDTSEEDIVPFSQGRPRNALEDHFYTKDFPLDNIIKVLFLQSDDLHTVLQTASGTDRCLAVHCNHKSAINTGRNLLLLKIISSPDFDVEDDECFNYLWDVWYSTGWTEPTKKRFIRDVGELLVDLPASCTIPSETSHDTLEELWQDWLTNLAGNLSEPKFVAKLLEERSNKNTAGWHSRIFSLPPKVDDLEGVPAGSDLQSQLKRAVSIHLDVKETLLEDAHLYFFATGNFVNVTSSPELLRVCLNPTYFRFKDLRWAVRYSSSPLDGFLPVQDRSSCVESLKNLLRNFRRKLDEKKITFTFYSENVFKLCFKSLPEAEFDVIDASNLSDQYGLVNLLNASGRILKIRPGALLLTEFQSSTTNLEEILCCPPSMLPTLYGFRLIDPNLKLNPSADPCLKFRRTPSFSSNICLDTSRDLESWLDRMRLKCYLAEEAELKLIQSERSWTEFYTPLTFSRMLGALIKRAGRSGDFQWLKTLILPEWDFPAQYKLIYGMMDEWMSGKIPEFVLIQSQDSKFEPEALDYAKSAPSRPILRLVLIPTADYATYIRRKKKKRVELMPMDYSKDRAHWIDNFGLDGTGRVKFLLPADHGMVATHSAVVIHVQTGIPLVLIGPMILLKSRKWIGRHDFDVSEGSPPPLMDERQIRLQSVIETDKEYRLVIAMPPELSPIKHRFATRSSTIPSHSITIKMARSGGSQTINLSFPHPFTMQADDPADPVKKDPNSWIQTIVLLKVAHGDPWPEDYHPTARPKWMADKLTPWIVKKDRSASNYRIHLEMQFRQMEERFFCLSHSTSALDHIRRIVSTIFAHVLLYGRMHFLVHCLDSPQYREMPKGSRNRKPDWYLIVEPAIWVSPLGAPMLLAAAYDSHHRSSAALPDATGCLSELRQIFPIRAELESSVLHIFTLEEASLFRSILRRNASVLTPNGWMANLKSGGPWMATFLSPCYAQKPRSVKEILQDFPPEEEAQ